jgi:serine protease inhibitor
VNFLRRFVTPALTLALTGLACSDSTPPDPTAPRPALTQLPRALTASERTVLTAANAYSFALWRTINDSLPAENVFVSPLSASFALGMTMNGADGTTYDEMRSALQFGDVGLAPIDSGYKSLITLLTSLDPSTTIQIANAIFYSQNFPLNSNFTQAAATYFDAAVTPRDFADLTGTLNAVNDWASSKTNGRIPKVLDSVDPAAVMYLLNAIYFKGSWRERFDPAETRDATFHAVRGDQSAKLMHRDAKTSYAETSDYQAIDLPYGDSAFTMTVVLPKDGRSVESVAASLTPSAWQSLSASFVQREVDLYLPKVTLSWKRELSGNMKALGMRAAFADGADFTRMSTLGHQLVLSLLQQNSFVSIDEEGTEAAAVTAVGIVVTSAPLVTTVRVDRPFIFVIRERLSGTVLFMGKIVQLS